MSCQTLKIFTLSIIKSIFKFLGVQCPMHIFTNPNLCAQTMLLFLGVTGPLGLGAVHEEEEEEGESESLMRV